MHKVESVIPWLNDALVFFTVSLQLCQQLKDKVGAWGWQGLGWTTVSDRWGQPGNRIPFWDDSKGYCHTSKAPPNLKVICTLCTHQADGHWGC